MKKRINKDTVLALVTGAVFAVFTLLVTLVDRQAIGPDGSAVGFATVNAWFRDLVGFHDVLYRVTEWLGNLSLLVVAVFGCIGAYQWIRRKRLLAVDRELMILGGFYLLVAAFYLFFEIAVVNVRPVILDAGPEASYPSSHTVLAICVLTTAVTEIRRLLADRARLSRILSALCLILLFALVVGRTLSGVHWISDILGGILLSVFLLSCYRTALLHFAPKE